MSDDPMLIKLPKIEKKAFRRVSKSVGSLTELIFESKRQDFTMNDKPPLKKLHHESILYPAPLRDRSYSSVKDGIKVEDNMKHIHSISNSIDSPSLNLRKIASTSSLDKLKISRVRHESYDNDEIHIIPLRKNHSFNKKESIKPLILNNQGCGDNLKRSRFKYDVKSIPGMKDGKDKINQDNTLIRDPWNKIKTLHVQLYALMDGHGDEGEKVTSFIKSHLCNVLSEEIQKVDLNNIKQALNNGIERLIQDLCHDSSIDSNTSGSTLVFCVIIENRLIVGNIGDSRCVLGRKRNTSSTMTSGLRVISLTSDHHPDRSDEMKRILESPSGTISRAVSEDDGCPYGPMRVWNKDGSGGGLAVSRSIGDFDASKNGVIGIPEFIERIFDDLDQFLILASDGVWDYISNEEAVEIIEKEKMKGGSPHDCAKILTDEARSRWSDSIHIDDITVIIVFLQEG